MYVGRTRAQIRDKILTDLQAEFAALPTPHVLLVTPGSPAYLWATALAPVLEAYEAQAQQVDRDILPDRADAETLPRHAYVEGMAKRPGTHALLIQRVTGALPVSPATTRTVTIPSGTVLTYSDGTRYTAEDARVTLDAAGIGALAVRAESADASGTREVGDVLSFVSAPATLDTTTTTTGITTDGEDEESDTEFAARITYRTGHKPGSGNVYDWQDWCGAFTLLGRVAVTFVYPLLQPPSPYIAGTPGTPGVAGYVTCLSLGRAQGDLPDADPSNGRYFGLASGARNLAMMQYILGALSADGALTPRGSPLIPATFPTSHFSCEVPARSPVNVSVQIVVSAATPFSFSAAPTVYSGTTTEVVVTGDYSATGVNLSGLDALINVGTAAVRGGYTGATLGTGVYNGGTGRTTFPLAEALAAAPEAGSVMRGYSSVWPAARDSVFRLFDALSPGDTVSRSFYAMPELDPSSTATSIVVVGDYSATGAVNLSGLDALVPVSDRFERITLGRGYYDGVSATSFVPSVPLTASPAVGGRLLGAQTGEPSRVPAPSSTYPTDLYPQALAAAAMNGDPTNILSAVTTSPAAPVYPAQKTVVTLGVFVITA